MATKVYLSGDIVFVEKTGITIVKIPQGRCESIFLGVLSDTPTPSDFTNVTISDTVVIVPINDLITNIQDSAGNAIGDFNAVRAYLGGFIFRSSSQLVEGDPIATAANQVEQIEIEAEQVITEAEFFNLNSNLFQKIIDELKAINKILHKIYQ